MGFFKRIFGCEKKEETPKVKTHDPVDGWGREEAPEPTEIQEKVAEKVPVYYVAALEEMGVEETPGEEHTPRVLEYLKTVGLGEDDETPWCSAFMNWCVIQEHRGDDGDYYYEGKMHPADSLSHKVGTGRANARSWLGWGKEVSRSEARKGDVVVLWRGSPRSWKGHVGIFEGWSGNKVMLLGGNQGNKVTIAAYPSVRVLSIRRQIR